MLYSLLYSIIHPLNFTSFKKTKHLLEVVVSVPGRSPALVLEDCIVEDVIAENVVLSGTVVEGSVVRTVVSKVVESRTSCFMLINFFLKLIN